MLAVTPRVASNPALLNGSILIIPPLSVDPSASARPLPYNTKRLLESTAAVTPVIAATLIALTSPASVLFVLAGTATDVPLITITLAAVRA